MRLHVRSKLGHGLPSRLYVAYEDWAGETFSLDLRSFDGDYHFDGSDIRSLLYYAAVPECEGFWTAFLTQVEQQMTIEFDQLPVSKDSNWWHAMLGDKGGCEDRGHGVRIGVVDADFRPRDDLDVTFVTPPSERYPDTAMWEHGEAVCRIIGDRHAPPNCAAIAPGSDLYFASGSFSSESADDPAFLTSFDDLGDLHLLDPTEVANGIVALAEDHEVDIINLSLGSFDVDPFAEIGIASAIETAREYGTIVICAAGNSYRTPVAFPAVLADCIGVGAFGRCDWGPPDTFTRCWAKRAAGAGRTGTWLGMSIFHSPESAYGTGLDTVAPGAGILISREGRPAFDVSGTSFAAPMVTGLLAVALAEDASYLAMDRNIDRSQHAERALKRLCTAGSLDSCYEGEGIASLP